MENSFFTSVLIAAAGKGTRMTSSKDKLLEPIGGRLVIERTLTAFEGAETVSEIILITEESNIGLYGELIARWGFHKVKAIVAGGKERADSVRKGLEALSAECRFISIHDGARPFITSEEIDRLHRIAYTENALCCGAKIFDTVKRLLPDGTIAETVERSTLGSAQTPQVFRRDIYEDAVRRAGDRISGYTDDASVVSAAGYPVRFEVCKVFNMKLTTDADLVTGRAYAAHIGSTQK